MTAGFLQIRPTKRRVALAGKVTDAVGKQPIEGATAAITAAPPAFQKLVALAKTKSGAAWDALEVRLDRAVTAADGCFGFADLPDGAYTVTVTAPAELRYGPAQQAYVVARDAAGDIAVQLKLIGLPPTGVRGTIVAEDTSSGMSLARVRVEGSGELAYCDATGAFYIAGVQPGSRRLTIAATGYQRGAATAQISLGTIVDLGTIIMKPAGA